MSRRLILAAHPWRTNAELIADCARLGYLRTEWRTLDPTFGRGTWWSSWRPRDLTTHDLRIDGVDFRSLPEPDGTFDAVVFDPPYVAPGGRTGRAIAEFTDRYGLALTPRSPVRLQRELIDPGVREAARVLRPGGYLLVKCKDYISSGKLHQGTTLTIASASRAGMRLVDRLEHIGCLGPQPRRRQVHARRNLSTLLVFRKCSTPAPADPGVTRVQE